MSVFTTSKEVLGSYVLRVLILAGLYTICGAFGLQLATVNRAVSPVWPASGLSLAVLLLFGIRYWPGVMIGALLITKLGGMPFLTAFTIATGNTIESLVAVSLLRAC